MNRIFLAGLALFLFACSSSENKTETAEPVVGKKILKPSYAQFFEIEIDKTDTVLRVFNPWKNKAVIQEIKLNGKPPVKSIVPMSTSFYGYLESLNELDKVVGVEIRDYVYNPKLIEGLDNKSIRELGQSGAISVEATIQMRPDLIIISGTEVLGPNLIKIQQSGINVLNDMDWQEQHPLGKAEWIKVLGLLCGKYAQADSLFTKIEERYNSLSDKLATHKPERKVDVILGYNYQGTWFMPGGKSYVARYLADAGAVYPYKNDSTTGSVPISSELVYKEYSEYPIWLNPGTCRNLSDLLLLDARYKNFKAFKNGGVYNNNRRSNATGGNDFWENSPANPDLVLADLVKIFYPDLLPDHKLYFYQRLE